jgi:hypothetical protein
VKDKWQHVTVTYKPGDWLVYMNGELVDEIHDKKGKLLVNDRPLKIGADPACAPEAFDGVIDEVVVFNRVLTRDEIKEVMEGMEKLMVVSLSDKLTTTWGKIKVK